MDFATSIRLLRAVELSEELHGKVKGLAADLAGDGDGGARLAEVAAVLDAANEVMTRLFVAEAPPPFDPPAAAPPQKPAPAPRPPRPRGVRGGPLPLWWRPDKRRRSGGYWCRKVDGRQVGFGADPGEAARRLQAFAEAVGRPELLTWKARPSPGSPVAVRRVAVLTPAG